MGYPADEARGALRLSLGRTTTADEVAQAVEIIAGTIGSQRAAAEALAASRPALTSPPTPPVSSAQVTAG